MSTYLIEEQTSSSSSSDDEKLRGEKAENLRHTWDCPPRETSKSTMHARRAKESCKAKLNATRKIKEHDAREACSPDLP